MAKYPLTPQRRTGQRMRWKLVLLAAMILALGVYDQFTSILGPNWLWIWLALVAVVIMWLYYALLMPRAAIHVAADHIRIQGPLYGRKLSFRRIRTVSPSKLEQHYPARDLSLGERPVLEPFIGRTCTFVELKNYPKAFRHRRWWFPRTLFGTQKLGMLCYVDDWMSLSRELESVRARQLANTADNGFRRQMTLAGRILAEDFEFD